MINITNVNCDGEDGIGLSITVPGGEQHPQMLMILCKNGFIMCGYLNMSVAEKLEDTAVVISGKNFDELLNGAVKSVTPKAKELGINEGMLGKEVMAILNK